MPDILQKHHNIPFGQAADAVRGSAINYFQALGDNLVDTAGHALHSPALQHGGHQLVNLLGHALSVLA